jgi:hypothetical protein
MPKNAAGLNTDAQVKTDPVRAKHTIGIDLGDRTTHFCVLYIDGTIAEEGRFRTEAAQFEKLASRFGVLRVAVEVGMQSPDPSRARSDRGKRAKRMSHCR